MTDEPAPRGCTCFRLRRMARRVTRVYDAHLAAAGLTLTQYSLLTALTRLPPPSLHELAETIGMDRTTLTRTLKPLRAQGLIGFAAGEDRRSKRVAITESGRTRQAAAKPHWRRAQDEIHARIGLGRVAELHRLLDQSFAELEAAS